MLLLATVTGGWDSYGTWWATSRMAHDFAPSMGASVMFFTITILTTRMRQNHRRVRWFFESATEALVSWQLILSIAIVAIWASPTEKCCHLLGRPSILLFLLIICSFFKVNIRISCIFIVLLFLLFVITLSLCRVELSNPSLDASKMEWL